MDGGNAVFGKFMNNYYYGKSGKGDYQKEDLPGTRWQLFWEMLRVRLAGLFRLNLVTAIAWLPMMYILAQLVSNWFGLAGLVQTVELDRAAATPEQLAVVENIRPLFNGLALRSLLFLVPAIALTGPFQAGMAYVTRNWSRDEHAFVWSDFKDAFIANWKQSLFIAFVTGLIPLIIFVGYQFYGGMIAQNILFIVPQMLTVMLGVLWMLATFYFYPLIVSYQLSLSMLLKNGLLLAVARLPQTAGLRLVLLIPSLIVVLVTWFMPSSALYVLMGLAAYYLLIGNAMARFVSASLSNAVFDRFINSKIDGVQTNRGLVNPEDLDDEYEEDEEA